jgi:hypothetical protein
MHDFDRTGKMTALSRSRLQRDIHIGDPLAVINCTEG